MSLPNAPWGPYEKRTLVVDQSEPEITQANGSVTLVNPDGTAWSPEGGSVTSDDITDASVAGRAVLTAADAVAQRTALGLGTAATTASSAYATSAQGTLASNAVPKTQVPTASLRGGVLQAAAIADLEADPTAADVNAILAALRTSGLLASA